MDKSVDKSTFFGGAEPPAVTPSEEAVVQDPKGLIAMACGAGDVSAEYGQDTGG